MNVDTIGRIFDRIDTDNDGRISRDEARRGLQALSIPYSKSALEQFVSGLDHDWDDEISRAEFISFVITRQEKLERVFQRLDWGQDGKLTRRDLRLACDSVDISLSSREIDGLIRIADENGDGCVSPEEFCRLLMLVGDVHIDGIFEQWIAHSAIEGGEQVDIVEGEPDTPTWLLLLSGAAAGAVSRTCTAPMDRMRTLLQAAAPSIVDKARSTITTAVGTAPSPSPAAMPAVPSTAAPSADRASSNASTMRASSSAQTVSKAERPRAGKSAVSAMRKVTGVRSAFQVIMEEGGVRGFWRGNGTNLIKIVPETGVRFASYEIAKTFLAKDPKDVSAVERFTAGAFAGILATFIIYPLEIAKTRMSLALTGEYNSFVDCLRHIVRKEGARQMYKGMGASLLGIIPYSGTELMTFSLLRDAYAKRFPDSEPGVPTLLACGAVASLAGQVVAFPLQLVRTRLQAQGMRGRPVIYSGITDCFLQTVRTEGFRGLYRGMTPGFMKSVPSCCIAFAVYEETKKALKKFNATRRGKERWL